MPCVTQCSLASRASPCRYNHPPPLVGVGALPSLPFPLCAHSRPHCLSHNARCPGDAHRGGGTLQDIAAVACCSTSHCDGADGRPPQASASGPASGPGQLPITVEAGLAAEAAEAAEAALCGSGGALVALALDGVCVLQRPGRGPLNQMGSAVADSEAVGAVEAVEEAVEVEEAEAVVEAVEGSPGAGSAAQWCSEDTCSTNRQSFRGDI